ncbi:hypothetical protein [Actinoallomurus sp. CA-150999]|uniref:hypothetical protein n=1 Tax=Actinoallomurus sp. CA-150999 TaxID=3239887 RepID=UPI003D9276F9
MGTWAAYLAFRTPADGHEPLLDRERVAVAVAGWTYLADDIRHHDQLRAALTDVPGPALLSVVCDSDYAEVTGHLDGESQWTAYINPEWAAGELDLPAPDVRSAEDEDLLDRITTWARAAGAPPVDRDRLREVFATSYIFADDGLLALEQLLGVISPEVRPFGEDQQIDYEIILQTPAGEPVSDEAIAEIEQAVQGKADPREPDENGHRVEFLVPKTHESAVAIPAFAAALRRLGISPATHVYWDGCDDWTFLAELDR